MYRGTTPTIVFKINTDIDLSEVDVCYITFKVNHNDPDNIKEFDTQDIVIDAEEKTLTIVLDQEDTLFFPVGLANVQIRLRTNDGLAYASNIKTVPIDRILKGGVI